MSVSTADYRAFVKFSDKRPPATVAYKGSLLPDTMPTECATVAHSTHHSNTGDMPMNTILVASLSLALILAVAALVRQVRLRRALQSLLCRLMKHWKEGEHD